jgi:predicted nucleic acid-binding protein
MTHLLDTSVYSQPIKDHPLESVRRRWSAIGDSAVCTAAVCLAEVLQGLVERQSEKYWRRYRALLEGRYVVLPFDERVAATYGELSGEQRRAGRPRPVVDLMIAATAKTHGLIIATLNPRDFGELPGVAVEDWT